MDPGSKVIDQYFIDHILSPMVTNGFPRLLENEASAVFLHMDMRPSYMARKTCDWLQMMGVHSISRNVWLPYSPNLALMDYIASHRVIENSHETLRKH